jgi:hypothetical protein
MIFILPVQRELKVTKAALEAARAEADAAAASAKRALADAAQVCYYCKAKGFIHRN